SSSLPSCRTFSLTASPLTAHGFPPFYMIAFAVNGMLSTSFIGTNESKLSWTVTYPVGTQLALGVVDSHGNSGGVDAPLYMVTAGSTTQCIPSALTAPVFAVTANVTDALSTCQPWGLTIRGRTLPYNVTLAALNAPDVTNLTSISTVGAADTVLTYINRATPSTQLIAAISDLNGRWATGSPMVRTQGSPNLDCIGMVSSSGTEPSELSFR
ncbi:hypothetical protein B0H10DRAFT_1852161, partial [Mycena sp. CBHHK59/15]